MTVAKLANSLTLNTDAKSPDEAVAINGEIFPWYILDEPIRFEAQTTGLTIVYLPVIVDGPVEVVSGRKREDQ